MESSFSSTDMCWWGKRDYNVGKYNSGSQLRLSIRRAWGTWENTSAWTPSGPIDSKGVGRGTGVCRRSPGKVNRQSGTRAIGLGSWLKHSPFSILTQLPKWVLLSHFTDEETEAQVNLPLSSVKDSNGKGVSHSVGGRDATNTPQGCPWSLKRLPHSCLLWLEKNPRSLWNNFLLGIQLSREKWCAPKSPVISALWTLRSMSERQRGEEGKGGEFILMPKVRLQIRASRSAVGRPLAQSRSAC